MQRDPVRPLVDRGRDIARGRQARVEDQRRREGRLLAGQRPEPDLLGDALGDQADAPIAQARARRDVLDPVVGDDQERTDPPAPRQLADDLEAQVVRPLEVLEPEHRRTWQGLDEQVDHVHDHPPPSDQPGVVASTSASSDAPVASNPVSRVIVAREVQDRRRGDIAILRGDRADRHRHPLPRRSAADRIEQCASCRSRLLPPAAGTGRARRRRREPPVDELEQVVASDEERAADGSERSKHRPRSVGRVRRRSSVVRPMTSRRVGTTAASRGASMARHHDTEDRMDETTTRRPGHGSSATCCRWWPSPPCS